jgi:hypothetical protein
MKLKLSKMETETILNKSNIILNKLINIIQNQNLFIFQLKLGLFALFLVIVVLLFYFYFHPKL